MAQQRDRVFESEQEQQLWAMYASAAITGMAQRYPLIQKADEKNAQATAIVDAAALVADLMLERTPDIEPGIQPRKTAVTKEKPAA
jgi:hypothetical protein